MSATRTQVYFTERQRSALDELAAREGKTLAQLVREAVDAYLDQPSEDVAAVLDTTFGSIPDIRAPNRDDWDRGYG